MVLRVLGSYHLLYFFNECLARQCHWKGPPFRAVLSMKHQQKNSPARFKLTPAKLGAKPGVSTNLSEPLPHGKIGRKIWRHFLVYSPRVICDGSRTTISATPRDTLIVPVTQIFFPA